MVQRREGRELVIKALYSVEISQNESSKVFSAVIEPKFKSNRKNFVFVKSLYYKIIDNKEILDEVIEEHIKNWEIERLATLDKVILRMALCEFLYFDEVPPKVSINEAIEIAKSYSTEKSGNFINGILDASLTDLKKKDKINKKGRGLIESSINS